jgi:hypothetical protein
MTNTVNEDYGVYVNGYFPPIGELADAKNNLKNITEQLYKSGKSSNQVFFILVGMGVPKERASFATEAYKVPVEKHLLHTVKVVAEKNQNIMNTDIFEFRGNIQELMENVSIFQKESAFAYSSKIASDTLFSIKSKLDNLQHVTESNDAADDQKAFAYKKFIIESCIEIVSKLSASNIESVNNYVKECSSYLKENVAAHNILAAMSSMSKKQMNNAYASVYESLQSFFCMNESEILENFYSTFRAHSWIPEVSMVSQNIQKLNNKILETAEAVVEKSFSPVIVNEDESYSFYLAGHFYKMNESSLERDSNPSSLLYSIAKAMSTFKVNENSLITYNRNKEFSIDLNESKCKLDGAEISFKNVQDLRNNLMSLAFVRVDEMHKLDDICVVLENLDKILELDFVTTLKSKFDSSLVNVFNLKESIYVNRISNSVNELVEAVSAINAQQLVNEFVNFDLSGILLEKLEGEKKEIALLNNSKNEISEAIEWLSSKKGEIQAVIATHGESEKLSEAISVLDEEISEKEKELQKIYAKLGNISEAREEDEGYTEGTLNRAYSKYKKGDKILINATQFSEGSQTTSIRYTSLDGRDSGSIPKGFVDVSI